MHITEPQAAAAVVGFATFEIWKVWIDTAPSISECRAAGPNDDVTRTQLLDADLVVGTMAVVIGTAFAVLTKNMTVLILLIVMFGALSFFHHYLVNDNPVT